MNLTTRYTVVVKLGYMKGEWTPTYDTNVEEAAIAWANRLFDQGANHVAVRDNDTLELIYHA